jgi:hypothetical protein
MRALRYIGGFLLEPAGFLLKCCAIAVLASTLSKEGAFFAFVTVLLFIPTAYISYLHRISSNALQELDEKLAADKGGRWRRAQAVSNGTLKTFFNFLQVDMPHRRPGAALFFLHREPSAGLTYRCYFNTQGASFVETPGPVEELSTIAPHKRFLVLHEIAHASFAGHETWAHHRFDAALTVIGAAVFLVLCRNFGWPHAAIVALALIVAIVYARNDSKQELSETMADYMAIRFIERSSWDDAKDVARYYIDYWKEHPGTDRVGLELLTAIRARKMRELLDAMEKVERGDAAIDPMNRSNIIRFPLTYLLGLACLYFLFDNVRQEAMPPLTTLTLALAILMLPVGAAMLISSRKFEQSILKRTSQ